MGYVGHEAEGIPMNSFPQPQELRKHYRTLLQREELL